MSNLTIPTQPYNQLWPVNGHTSARLMGGAA